MGLLSALSGNASEVDVSKVEKDLDAIMIDGEQVQHAFKLVRDLIVFTDKRLILIDKQGVTGKKSEYHSIPYRSISHFMTESKGHFDRDAEMKIFISSRTEPLVKQFKDDGAIVAVQKVLARYVVG